jgi:predicted O-methyltransferase YrrM
MGGSVMRDTGTIGALKRAVITYPGFRPLLSGWFGTLYSTKLFLRKALSPYWSILRTGEFHNFTYELTDSNLRYLAETLSVVTGKPPQEIEGYIREAITDQELAAHLHLAMEMRNRRGAMQSVRMPFGRRLGWYAIARVIKPKVIIETGVERGHGSVLLCSALMRNAREGFPGRYYGTDIDPNAGWLLGGEYARVGEILYGDSIKSLEAFADKVDLFINDSDHSADYEAAEYRVIRNKLADGAIILSDNAHVTDKLALFGRETGRCFVFFKEEPKDHWYPGAGIGIAYGLKA